MLAACDSFRAGAVKQLQTHGNALNVPVFAKGHDDDPAKRAYACIREARSKGIDVVLIDTAGRMQDNEPLMKELARLVQLNKPKLVIFIGEALVGNDGVDQLTKFNSALINYSQGSDERREIDAIIISKFDTVDEKGEVLTIFLKKFNFNFFKFLTKNSWCSHQYDLRNRKTNYLPRNWTEISKS